MKVEWYRSQVEEIKIDCPFCGQWTTPPHYPYCSHTVFVYVDPSSDFPGFDYVRADFARAYLTLLKSTASDPDDKFEIDLESEEGFLQGLLPPFHEQVVRLQEDVVFHVELPEALQVHDITGSSGYYPCRVVVGFTPGLDQKKTGL